MVRPSLILPETCSLISVILGFTVPLSQSSPAIPPRVAQQEKGRQKEEERVPDNVKGEIRSPTPKQPQSASMPRRKVTPMTPMKKTRKRGGKAGGVPDPDAGQQGCPTTISSQGRIFTTQTTESGDSN